jgi:hypothetical protein
MAIVEFAAHNTQKIKLGVHIVQSVLILVSWIIDIVIFRSDASIDGRVGWHFGVVWFSGGSTSPEDPEFHSRLTMDDCSASLPSQPSST